MAFLNKNLGGVTLPIFTHGVHLEDKKVSILQYNYMYLY